MRFSQLDIQGVFVIDAEPHEDLRGLFARLFCREEFSSAGLPTDFVQFSTSYNQRRGTLRGMHLQAAPHEECKLVRCTSGCIYDVALDLRRESLTYGKWRAVELSQSNRRSVLIPAGVAHGFQTLTDGAEVLYHMTEFYHPDLSRGVRWNDPSFAIEWPIATPIVAPRDADYVDFDRNASK